MIALLDRIDLAGAAVTADAPHTVKRNQPGLHAPTRQPALAAACRTRDKGHGRAERRTLKITAVAAGLAFPHAAQVIQIVRRRRPLTGKNSKKWSTETVYAITSLIVIQARPADLARFVRGHRE